MIKKIIAVCGYKISPRCYGEKQISLTDFYRNRKRNGGKFKCKICAAFDNKTKPRKLLKNDNYFTDINSEIQAYMLGVIAGDGNIKNNTLRIVAHNDDIETLNLFKINISPQSNIKKYKNQNCSYISFSSAQIIKDVCKHLNIIPGKKSDKISLPLYFHTNLLWHFIRGLVDTDGSILNLLTSKRTFPVCSYASKSLLIKDQIKNLCKSYNINYTEDKISIIFNGKNAVLFLDKIYSNSTITLSRKYELYKIIKTWTPQQGIPNRPRKIRKDKGTIKCSHIISLTRKLPV